MMTHEIKFTCESTPKVAENRIRRMVSDALTSGLSPRWSDPVSVTEGREKCGYGALEISGTVEHFVGASYVYRLENRGSQWRNYGAPHGTRYYVHIALVQI